MHPEVAKQHLFCQIQVYVTRAFYDQVRSGTITQYEIKYAHTRKISEIKKITIGDSLLFTCEENIAFLPKEHQKQYQRQLERIVTHTEEDITNKKRIIHFKNSRRTSWIERYD